MKYPEFIIVSAYKAGSTALWCNLHKHPKIHMAKKKEAVEMNFWGLQFYKKGHDYYKSFFPDEYICGEKTPGYYLSKKSMRSIYNFIPDCKIILAVRHPVDRAFSHFQMNFKKASPAAFTKELFMKRYSRAGKYFTLMENNIFPFFDKSQVYVVVMENMKKNTTDEMKKLFEFIGVEDLGYPSKEIDPLLRKNRTRNQDVKLSQSQKFYRVWSRYPTKLTGRLRNELLEFYKTDNEKLFDFLGYEVEEWKK